MDSINSLAQKAILVGAIFLNSKWFELSYVTHSLNDSVFLIRYLQNERVDREMIILLLKFIFHKKDQKLEVSFQSSHQFNIYGTDWKDSFEFSSKS